MVPETQTVCIRGICSELFHDIEEYEAAARFTIREYGCDMISTGTNNFDAMLKFVRSFGDLYVERPEKSKGVFRIYRAQKNAVKWFGYEAKSRGIKPSRALQYLLWWITASPDFEGLLLAYLEKDPSWSPPCN